MELIDSIKEHEGFDGKPYRDTEGFLTIGYGTKLPISRAEGEMLLKNRLDILSNELIQKEPMLLNLPSEKQGILFEMAYQMGVNGVLKFKKMWQALENFDYVQAAVEMLDSRWAKQTPNRAQELAKRMGE